MTLQGPHSVFPQMETPCGLGSGSRVFNPVSACAGPSVPDLQEWVSRAGLGGT